MSLPDYQWLRERVESEQGRAHIRKAGELLALSRDLACPLPQLAVAWCLKNPDVSTVILGASNPDQLGENLQALDALPLLTDEVMDRIEVNQEYPLAQAAEAHGDLEARRTTGSTILLP